MYCKNCGTQLDDRAVICPHCGVPTDNYYTPGHKVEGTSIRHENTEDMPNAGTKRTLLLLSHCRAYTFFGMAELYA